MTTMRLNEHGEFVRVYVPVAPESFETMLCKPTPKAKAANALREFLQAPTDIFSECLESSQCDCFVPAMQELRRLDAFSGQPANATCVRESLEQIAHVNVLNAFVQFLAQGSLCTLHQAAFLRNLSKPMLELVLKLRTPQ